MAKKKPDKSNDFCALYTARLCDLFEHVTHNEHSPDRRRMALDLLKPLERREFGGLIRDMNRADRAALENCILMAPTPSGDKISAEHEVLIRFGRSAERVDAILAGLADFIGVDSVVAK